MTPLPSLITTSAPPPLQPIQKSTTNPTPAPPRKTAPALTRETTPPLARETAPARARETAAARVREAAPAQVRETAPAARAAAAPRRVLQRGALGWVEAGPRGLLFGGRHGVRGAVLLFLGAVEGCLRRGRGGAASRGDGGWGWGVGWAGGGFVGGRRVRGDGWLLVLCFGGHGGFFLVWSLMGISVWLRCARSVHRSVRRGWVLSMLRMWEMDGAENWLLHFFNFLEQVAV